MLAKGYPCPSLHHIFQPPLFPAKRRIFIALIDEYSVRSQLQFCCYYTISSALPLSLIRHLTEPSSTKKHTTQTRIRAMAPACHDRRDRQITPINQQIPSTTNLHLKHLVPAPFQPYHNPHNPPHTSAT